MAGRRGTRAIAVLAAFACAAAAGPPAFAHALLLETEPPRGAVVPESPHRVALTFNERVETAVGSIRVYDGNADLVDTGGLERSAPEVVSVPVDDELPRGTYTVTWRVVSADSDPISGAFVFHVKAPGRQPSGVAAEVLEGTPTLVTVLYDAARFFDYVLRFSAPAAAPSSRTCSAPRLVPFAGRCSRASHSRPRRSHPWRWPSSSSREQRRTLPASRRRSHATS